MAPTSCPLLQRKITYFECLAGLKKIIDLMCRGGRYDIHCLVSIHSLVSGTAGYGSPSRYNRIVETVGKELGAVMPLTAPK